MRTLKQMADLDAEQKGTAQTIATRLWNGRWLLAAGVVAVVAVYALAASSAYVVLAALLLLLAAAMLPARANPPRAAPPSRPSACNGSPVNILRPPSPIR